MRNNQNRVGIETMNMMNMDESQLIAAAWWHWDNQSENPEIATARLLQGQFLLNVAMQRANDRRHEYLLEQLRDITFALESLENSVSQDVSLDEIAEHLDAINFNSNWILDNWKTWQEDPTKAERKRPERVRPSSTKAHQSHVNGSVQTNMETSEAPDAAVGMTDIPEPTDPVVALVQKDFEAAMDFFSNLSTGDTFMWNDFLGNCALDSAQTILYVSESMGIIESSVKKVSIKTAPIRFIDMPDEHDQAEILDLFITNAKHDNPQV